MDLTEVMNGSGWQWTDERHSRFLDWIEGAFVQQMLYLSSDDSNPPQYAARLGHRIADCDTDSTADSWTLSPPATAVDLDLRLAAIPAGGETASPRKRKRAVRRCDAAPDQVVREFRKQR